jgi:nucleotide-binding universal stress UspA family protein
MYKTILVGTDGSPTSFLAVERAADMAAELRAELRVVVVYEQGHGTELAPLIARGGRTPELLQAVRHYTSSHGSEPEFHLLAGDAAEQVVALARELQADLVIVGSKGVGTKKDAFKGSIPTKISRNAACDVLIVRTT